MKEALKACNIISIYNCLDKLSRAIRSHEEMDFPVGDYEVIVYEV